MKYLATRSHLGITFIELLIFLATVSICLAGIHSWLANHTIRSRIDEAVAIAETAKTAIEITCTEDRKITELNTKSIGYQFPTSMYIESTSLGGSCDVPVITIVTLNTGLLVDPKLTITGAKSKSDGQLQWTCSSDGLEVHLPKKCHG